MKITILLAKEWIAIVLALAAIAPATGTGAPGPEDAPQVTAWAILQTGVTDNHANTRAIAVRVLGLIHANTRGTALAEKALSDDKSEVRAAGAFALGSMGAEGSIPKLQELLQDKDLSVVLESAQALVKLGDSAGYEVYYAILTRERKATKGVLGEQEKMLKDPKKMAEFGFEQGIGFVPFAGIGWEAFKSLSHDDVSPVRAAAAKILANDKDPSSGDALVGAASDKSWIVRVAALDAIGRRKDVSLVPKIVFAMDDNKEAVRYTAAAVIVELSALPPRSPAPGNY
jgi:HEAT repeat protein